MCSADWPLVTNLLAAVGSCSAAIVAVIIATSDRRERKRERLEAAKAQATLVMVDIKLGENFLGFVVDITNFGSHPILDIELDSAQFSPFPKAESEVVNTSGPMIKVLDAHRSTKSLYVKFNDVEGNPVITGTKDRKGIWVIDNAEQSQASMTIRFMDSQGRHWLRSPDSVKLA
jgi:hypothetical protein